MKAGNQTDDISDDQMYEICFYFSHMETGEKDHDEISKSAAPVVNQEITLTNPHNCKTGDTSDDKMDMNRITYTETGDQDYDEKIQSTALVDDEKFPLKDSLICMTDDTSDDIDYTKAG